MQVKAKGSQLALGLALGLTLGLALDLALRLAGHIPSCVQHPERSEILRATPILRCLA